MASCRRAGGGGRVRGNAREAGEGGEPGQKEFLNVLGKETGHSPEEGTSSLPSSFSFLSLPSQATS